MENDRLVSRTLEILHMVFNFFILNGSLLSFWKKIFWRVRTKDPYGPNPPPLWVAIKMLCESLRVSAEALFTHLSTHSSHLYAALTELCLFCWRGSYSGGETESWCIAAQQVCVSHIISALFAQSFCFLASLVSSLKERTKQVRHLFPSVREAARKSRRALHAFLFSYTESSLKVLWIEGWAERSLDFPLIGGWVSALLNTCVLVCDRKIQDNIYIYNFQQPPGIQWYPIRFGAFEPHTMPTNSIVFSVLSMQMGMLGWKKRDKTIRRNQLRKTFRVKPDWDSCWARDTSSKQSANFASHIFAATEC